MWITGVRSITSARTLAVALLDNVLWFAPATGAVRAHCVLASPQAGSSTPGAPTPPPLHIEDLQLRSNAATPAAALALLQHCQALVSCRWQQTLRALDTHLESISRLQMDLPHLPPSNALSPSHVRAVLDDFARHASQAALQVAPQSRRLSGAQAEQLCNELWDAVQSAEDGQVKLRGVLEPFAAAAHSTHSAARGDAVQLHGEVRDHVDAALRGTEGALLMSRMLLRHAAYLLAFVHSVSVPVHPSLHHKVGKVQVVQQAPVMAAAVTPGELVRQAVADVRGFAVEKYGIPPDVSVHVPAAADSQRVTCVPPLVLYVLSEVLKNSVTALEAQHGAWDLDEAAPIAVTVRAADAHRPDDSLEQAAAHRIGFWTGELAEVVRPKAFNSHAIQRDGETGASTGEEVGRGEGAGRVGGDTWEVEIVDHGGGIPEHRLADIGRFFYSTVQASPAAGYGYSKDHGAVFSGLGVGIPMARLYADTMGGRLAVQAHQDVPRPGMRVTLRLPSDGFSFQC
eukprot:jgi/Ulvmu1/4042/UM019_0019.1